MFEEEDFIKDQSSENVLGKDSPRLHCSLQLLITNFLFCFINGAGETGEDHPL